MKLELLRTYLPEGTNGDLMHNGLALCHTIELPWKDNQQRLSCIPEGEYELVKRYSRKFGWHLLVKGVASRSLILVHPANDALKELQGCIAPVSILTCPGKGSGSRKVFKKLLAFVEKALDANESVHLIIKKK
jgi:hypothetical protein